MLHADGYEARGVQWVVDEDTGKLIGTTIVSQNVADLLHANTVTIVGVLTLETLSQAVPSFPTISEVYLNLIEAARL
jgi:dihydrolipoamide dehydrogenase